MSSRRSRSRQSGGSRITDDQINDLVSKLQQLLPEIRDRRSDKVNFPFILPNFLLVCKFCFVGIYEYFINYKGLTEELSSIKIYQEVE